MMEKVKTIIEGNIIKVESSYNIEFINKARQMQGKWEKPFWIFPLKNKKYVIEALINFYGDCGNLSSEEITYSEVTLDLDKYPYDNCIRIDKLIIAERPSRDRGVVLSSNVLVMQGGFEKSGGSAKYPNIQPFDGTILRVDNVPMVIAEKINNLDGVVTIKKVSCIRNNTDDKKALLEEKERLLKRLNEINLMLSE